MSTLLGRPLPANSVGVLPDVYVRTEHAEVRPGYLAPRGGEEAKSRAAVINAKVTPLWICLA
jgi:hypothetical protein